MKLRDLSIVCLGTAFLTACAAAPHLSGPNVKRGQTVYAKECAQCHGTAAEGGGAASLGLGFPPPDLIGLRGRNDGVFPSEFVRRFVLGLLEKDPSAAMPDFASVGLRHVYPQGGADGEVLEADFEDLLDYLEAIQQ